MALITEFWSVDGLILFTLLITLAYAYLTRNFNYWKKRNVEQISPLPLFGNFRDVMLLKKSSIEWVEEWYKLSAPLPYFGFYILDKPFLIIRDPELIKHILIKDSHIFQDRNASAGPNDPLGAATSFFTKGAKWKYSRAKLTPVFTSGKLRKMFDLMLDVCNDLRTLLESQNEIGDGVVLEMKEVFGKFATDLIGTIVFGIRVNSLNNPDTEFRKHGREILSYKGLRSYDGFAMFLAPHLTKLLDTHFYNRESESFFRHAFWSILNEREKSEVKRNDLIDTLIELRKNQTEEEKKMLVEFDGDNLAAQALTFFSAGFESSSTAMTFASYEIAKHPEVQDKLRREIRTALEENNGKLTYELVEKLRMIFDSYFSAIGLLKYLAVIRPTIFRHGNSRISTFTSKPGLLDRIPSQDYKIPGSNLILEKGIPVVIPVAGLHMDEEYYPQPRRFNPENFSMENRNARNTAVYLAFGDGPRNCIGARYALLQIKLGLITLLSNYEILPCEKTVSAVKLDPRALLSSSKDGIYLKVRKVIE